MSGGALRWLGLVMLGGALVLASFFLSQPALADNPGSLDEYQSAIASALTQVEQAQALAPAARDAALKQAAATLAAIQLVKVDSGGTVQINNAQLVAQIPDPNQIPASIERLTALQTATSAPMATISQSDLDRLASILSRPPFAQAQSNWFEQLLQSILAYIDRLLTNTARGIFEVRDLLVLLGFLVAGGIVAFLVLNLRRNMVAEEVLPPALVPGDARTSAEAFTNAQRFIQAGDLRSAVRQLYLATLYILDQRGRIKFDPTLTNREYLTQASADAGTLTALRPIIETFDRTWYGFEPISEQEFGAYRERVEKVRDL